jgi:hypothetical protein
LPKVPVLSQLSHFRSMFEQTRHADSQVD